MVRDATETGAKTNEILSGNIAAQLHDLLRHIVDPEGHEGFLRVMNKRKEIKAPVLVQPEAVCAISSLD